MAFNFTSPGAAATESLLKFLSDREAKQRQAMLDDLERQRVEREKASQAAQAKYYEEMTANERRRQDLADKQHADALAEAQRQHDEANAARISTEALPGDVADQTMQDLLTRTGRASQMQPGIVDITQSPGTLVEGTTDTIEGASAIPGIVMRGGSNYMSARKAAEERAAQAEEAAKARADEAQRQRDFLEAQKEADRQNARAIAQMGADIKGAAAADKKAEAERLRKAAADSAYYATQETLDELNGTYTDAQGNQQTTEGLLDAKGNLSPSVASVAGANYGKVTRYIPGTAAADAQARLDRLKDRLVTDLMAEMKAQSRTGATGFGALSEKELVLLQSAAARLSLNQSPESLREALLSIRNRVQRLNKNADAQRGVAAPAPGTATAPSGAVEYVRDANGRLVRKP